MTIRSTLLTLALFAASGPAVADNALSMEVGDVDVTATGQFRYTHPLWTPPGVRGIEPRLALLYGSDVSSPTLGTGWTLGGLSKIARCNRTVAQHATAQAVLLTMTDAFCLDGQTLRVTSGLYGQANSQYQTEVANFALVTAQGSLGNGPQSFEVKTKEGLVYEYGATVDSRALLPGIGTPHVWALNKIRDRDGNNLKVTYTLLSGTLVPTLIQYTQTASDSSYPYAVVFNYVARTGPDIDSGYVAGSNFTQSQQLSTIEVRHGGPQGTLVRRYSMTYFFYQVVRRSLLIGIQTCAGSDGLDCTGTSFSHYPGVAGVVTAATADGSIDSTGRILIGDITGDGRSDIVYQESGPTKRWWMRMASGTGFAAPVFTGVMQTDDLLMNDFVGSGREELLAPTASGGAWTRWWWNGTTFSSTGTGLVLDPNVIRGNNPFGPSSSFASADINGDGLADMIWAAIYNNTPSIFTRLNTTAPGGALTFSSTMTAAYSLPLPISTFGGVYADHAAPSSDVQRMDFDGDQRSDAYFMTFTGELGLTGNSQQMISLGTTFASGPVISDYGYMAAPLNFNDDGCTDFAQGIRIRISACNGTAGQTIDTTSLHIGYMDWNGDGRTDILVWDFNTNLAAIVYSNGGSAAAPISQGVPVNSSGVYLALDQDGDGLTELGVRNTSTGAFGFHRHNGAGTKPGALAAVITNGGNSWSINYKSIAQSNYALSEATIQAPVFPQAQFIAPMYVVSRVISQFGTKDYFYWSARKNLQGRSFQGFARRRILDNRSGMYFYEDYKDAFPYLGQLWRQRLYQSNDATLVYQRTDTWSSLTLDNAPANFRFYPYISGIEEKRYEAGGAYNGTLVSRRLTTRGVDNWGTVTNFNVDTIEDATGVNPGAIHSQGYTYPTVTNDTVNWCLGRPTQMQSRASSNLPGGTQIVRTTNYAWDNVKCRLTSEVTEPNNAQWQVTKALEYDAFGNLKKVTLTPASGQGQVARNVQVGYGTTGQFPRTLTDAKGFATQLDWDAAKGVRTSMTDPNGLLTTWTYDNFGRVLRETRPDGTKTEQTYVDCWAPGDLPSPCIKYSDISPRYEFRTTLLDAANAVIRSESRYVDNRGITRVIERDRMSGPRSIQRFTYDSWPRLTQMTAPFIDGGTPFWTSYTYDALSRVTRIRRPMSDTDATNNDTLFGYSGLTQTRTDALGHTTTTKRDPLGRIVQVVDAANQDTDYEYDPFGNLLKIRDPAGAETTMTYNIRGMKMSSSDPDMGPWTYDYFPLGEVKSQTDAKGKTITFTFDELSRILTRTMPEGASGSITSTFVYGSSSAAWNIGRLESMETTGTGVTFYKEAYLYDNRARLSQTTYTEGSTNYLVNYAYDANHGLLSQLTYPTSTSGFRLPIQYEYQHGMLSRVFDSANQFWIANATDGSDRVTSETLGEVVNGVSFQTLSGYDQVTGLLESRQSTFNSGAVAGTPITNFGFAYDAGGNMVQRQDNQQGLTENFYYDVLDRLDYSTLGAATTDYSYDNRGNLTAKTGVGTLYSYTANVAGCTYYTHPQVHAVRQITGGSSTLNFCYDANGNMTNRNGTSLTWYANNLPKAITKDANNSSTFEYGPDGRRWRHVYRTAGGNYTHTYIGKLAEKVVGPTFTEWKHYIYANDEQVALYIRQVNGSKPRYHFAKDRLGSMAAIVRSDGVNILRESFDAFGQRRRPSTWTGTPSATELTQMNDRTRRGFTMHEHLDSTGLIHMNGRVYDPAIARFVSADPFVQNRYNLQMLNRYSYVANNPLRATDPSGFFSDICPGCDINLPPNTPWPDLDIELCFFNCPGIPMGPPAHTPVTCITIRGRRLCGDGDLNLGGPRTAPPAPPPLTPGAPAPEFVPRPLPEFAKLAAENVATLPWFWARPNTNQQIVSQRTGQVYTRVEAPPGYGIDRKSTANAGAGGPGITIGDVRFAPLSEETDLGTHVYVEVVTGDILTPDPGEGVEDAEKELEDKAQALEAAEMKKKIRDYEDALERGERNPPHPTDDMFEEHDRLMREAFGDPERDD
jgi:RHS repeat-associated protein